MQKAGCQIIFASLLCCCAEELRSWSWKLALKAESDSYFCSPILSDFFRQHKSRFIPLFVSDGGWSSEERKHLLLQKTASRSEGTTEGSQKARVKWSWSATSLQVFPASAVMKMLTLVLVSSAPTTPEYKQGPKLVIPIISNDKTNPKLYSSDKMEDGDWNSCGGKADLIWVCGPGTIEM